MENLKAYQIPQFILEAIEESKDENGNIDNNMYQDTVDMILSDKNIEEKLESVRWVILNLTGKEKALKEEYDRIKKLHDNTKKDITRLKNLISSIMEFANKDKLDTGLAKFSFRKSKSIEVVDIEKIPEEYKRTKIEVEADKTKIKNALKENIAVEGIIEVEKKSLQIK